MPGVASDPDIVKAYERVRSDKDETDWLLLSYKDNSDRLEVKATGNTGLSGLQPHLTPTTTAYAYLRLTLSTDSHSKRTKFVLLIFCGPSVPVMRKAKVSIHTAEVKDVIKSYAVEVAAEDVKEVTVEAVGERVKKAMGADYGEG